MEQAKEVRSQPLTAIRKLGEACQPLPVPGPSQSSCFMVRLEFQARMFSRQQWGKCKFQRLRQHFAGEFFSLSAFSLQEGLPGSVRCLLGMEQGQEGLGSSYSQGPEEIVGTSSMCQALLHRCNHFMVPAGFNMQTEVNCISFLSFLDCSLSSHPQIKSQAGLIAFLGLFSFQDSLTSINRKSNLV